jgi:hypothetical protein
MNINDENFEIPEISFEMCKFEIKGGIVFCMLEKTQVPIMTDFFKTLENDGVSWSEAKEKTLSELIQNEFPNLDFLERPELKDRFKISSRSAFIFQSLEKETGVQNLIKSIERDLILNKIIKDNE